MAKDIAVLNTEDERLTDIKLEGAQKEAEVGFTYDSMAAQSDKFYDAKINATKDWEKTQSQLQQENTDFTIEKIEQQKEQSHKDYIKEQSGAYADWQKQSNAYGVNAEIQAANGLANSGYSESSKVSMYNTYQNRVATAREAQQQAVLNYNNAIKEAQMQNNSILAEIANQSLQQQLDLSIAGFQYKNTLITEKLSRQLETKSMYNNMYMSMLDQINQEKAMAENIRQFNKTHKLQNKQFKESKRQWEAEMAFQQAQADEANRQWAQEFGLQQAKVAASSKGSGGGGVYIDDDGGVTANMKGASEAANKVQEMHDFLYTGGRASSNQVEAKETSSGEQITTAYYKGPKAEDVGGYGYMEDREYQPKGIEIDGKAYELKRVSKLPTSNAYYTFETETLSGEKRKAIEPVWTANGRYFYWDDSENRYKELSYVNGYYHPKS